MATLEPVPYEAVSAFSTAGLSVGVAPWLGDASPIILVVTLHVGRIGAPTSLWVFRPQRRPAAVRAPKEPLLVS